MRTVILFAALLLSFPSVSLSQTRVEKVAYQKADRDALVIEIPFPEKTVSGAILDTMQKMGFKEKSAKGFSVYNGVKMQALGEGSYDLYFSTERKSKKEKETSVVTLLISAGLDNFVSSSAQVVDKAKLFMDSFPGMVQRYDLELQIAEQEDLVKKNDKKMEAMIDEAAANAKAKKKLEEKIADHEKAVEKQREQSEVQKKILETLKAKRGS